MSQVLEAPVVAHVFVAAVQSGGGGGEGIRPPGTRNAAADVGRVGDGVQAAVRQGRVGVERVQDLGEAGVQLRLAHVSSGYAVRRVAVAPDFSWEAQRGREVSATPFDQKPPSSTNGLAANARMKAQHLERPATAGDDSGFVPPV